jgi:hypothetical protein
MRLSPTPARPPRSPAIVGRGELLAILVRAPQEGKGRTDMQITQRQGAALSRPSADSFNQRALAFLERHYPNLARRAGDERFMRLVEHGRARAVLHGFTSERHIVQYLLLLLHLGPRFDQDPDLATLQPLLDPASPMAPAWRLNILTRIAARRPEPGSDDGH